MPLLFILPPSNLRDSPPFKSEFDSTTFANVQFDIARLLRTACDVASSDLSQAVGLASQARDLDPRYARSWYELAQLQELAGLPDAAQSYRTARDEDICPLRMTTSLEHAMRSAARDSTRPLLDAHALLAERCAGRIVGGSVLVDHVHPSFRGHEDIAVAIADWMMNEQYLVPVNPLWAEHSRTECGHRLQRLDDLYFLRGQRSLQSMQLWSAGRSGGPPLAALPERRGSKSVQQ